MLKCLLMYNLTRINSAFITRHTDTRLWGQGTYILPVKCPVTGSAPFIPLNAKMNRQHSRSDWDLDLCTKGLYYQHEAVGWPQHIQLAAQLRLQEQYQWGYHISTAKRQDDIDYSSTEVSIEMMFADAVKALGGDTYSWSLYNVVVLTTISTSRNTEGPAYISGVRPNISQVKSKRLRNQGP